MKVTIVTLYRGESALTYVGCVEGTLTAKEKKACADRFKLKGDDCIGFVVTETKPKDAFSEVKNALERGFTGFGVE